MEFDISRVYTAVNAEELPVGSKCYLSDGLRELKVLVVKENVIKPFETIEEAREAITAHGGFIKNKDTGYIYLVTGYSNNHVKQEIFIRSDWYSLERITKDYVFADDGSPCGKIAEE